MPRFLIAERKLRITIFALMFATLSFATSWAGLTKTEVSQLYVSIFNRASEGEGNAYWQSQPDMAAAAATMLDMQAAKDYFGANLNTNQAFIQHIYLNTLNKTIADDSAGINYWVGELNKGKSRSQVVATLVDVIKDYAPGGPNDNPNDAKTVATYRQFTNRVAVSDYLAENQWETLPDWETITRFGAVGGLNVTDDAASVSEAKNFISNFAVYWKHLVEAKELQSIPAFIIRNAAAITGYAEFKDYFKHNIKAVRLVYKTEYKGIEIHASGLLCYPLSNEKSYPLIVFQNGLFIADHQAPSAFNVPNQYIGYEFIASAGYFILIPDLIGLGASKDILFQMYNAKYAASATIDMMKAAEEYISTKKLPLSDKIFLSGYSMGAFATNATLKAIESQNFRNITATAIGAGGYNLVEIMKYAFTREAMLMPGQLALFFASYNETYEWDRPLSDFFSQPYASKIPELINGDYAMEEIEEQLTNNIESLFNPIFLNRLINGQEAEFIAALRENSVFDWVPRSLLRLYHSKNDELIPFSDSWDTYQAMKAAGSTTVDFEELSGNGHSNAVPGFIRSVLPWFESLKEN